jgi:hypothetical protein
MAVAPSHLDLFDYKPKLKELEGKPLPPSIIGNQRFAFIRGDAGCDACTAYESAAGMPRPLSFDEGFICWLRGMKRARKRQRRVGCRGGCVARVKQCAFPRRAARIRGCGAALWPCQGTRR